MTDFDYYYYGEIGKKIENDAQRSVIIIIIIIIPEK